MIFNLLTTILSVGVPVGIFSFLMTYFAYAKGYVSIDVEIEHAFKNQHDEKSTLSKKHKKSLLFLHSKWVAFGGGFYGLIALLTFIYIELSQIVNFWFSVKGWDDVTALFNFNTLISMFIDSILNMIKSAVWFTYWPYKLNSINFIVIIFIAYIGYRYGAKFAKRYVIAQRQQET